MAMTPADVRRLRPVDPPLASYLRPFRRDLGHIAHLIAQDLPAGSGVVLDPLMESQSTELRSESRRAGMEVVLDSRAMELATEGGFARTALSQLAWAGVSQHRPGTFLRENAPTLVAEFAETACRMDVSAVLAPTHYLGVENSSWFQADLETTRRLRRALDERGATDIAIYYPWATTFAAITERERERVLAQLAQLPIDAVWLRIHNFGTRSSGPVNLRRYVALCREAHRLGLPIVGEHTGTIGLALLALGAVGGLESGITVGDTFSVSSLLRRNTGKGFVPEPRVYLHTFGAMERRTVAEPFLRRRGMSGHVCSGRLCCRRGVIDMISDPRRHFIVTRSKEVQDLSLIPAGLRVSQYMEKWLRPASDRATRAMQAEPAFEAQRSRLDRWRGTVAAIVEQEDPATVSRSATPEGGRIRRRRGA